MKVDNVIDALKLLVDLGLIPLEEGADKTMVELPTCVVQKLIDIAYNAKQPKTDWRSNYRPYLASNNKWVMVHKIDIEANKALTLSGWVDWGCCRDYFTTETNAVAALKMAPPPN